MKTKLIIVALVSLLSFSIEAKPRKKAIKVQTFTEWSYSEGGFHATQTSEDEALVTSDFADGVYAPLPFRIIRGEMTQGEFHDTLIFVTDNLSEAFIN